MFFAELQFFNDPVTIISIIVTELNPLATVRAKQPFFNEEDPNL
jgi:hypothetical protein